MKPMISQALRAIGRAVFLLGVTPERSALPLANAPSNLVSVRRLARAERRLRRDGQTVAAVVLARETLLVLGRDITAEVASHPTSRNQDRIDRLLEALRRANLEPPPELERQRALLSSADPRSADHLDPTALERAADDLEACIARLSSWLSPVSAAELTCERGLRIGAVALILVVVLGWIAVRLTRPKDLALNRPVRASSHAYSTTPEGAVDGIRYGAQLGFHSDEQDEPWLSIDLGREVALTRVAAYGRVDCCYDQSIPLAFEVSDDGVKYRRIAKRETIFSQADPWIIEPERESARFVRFRTLRHSYLVLSEVEVYGR